MNALRLELLKRFGSQIEAANAMGIRENRLSYIIHGHVVPTERERRTLERTLGEKVTKKLLRNLRTK
jgi:ribosome-binding protein aMBF1 (putative translation factor)